MPTNTNPKLSLPQIQRVQLHAFSLYSLEPNISLPLRNGVTCLAGANGIGKSTFLSTINFALTGVVPEPTREFKSAGAYLHKAREYTNIFFEGRIAEFDREAAAVTIEFTIKDRHYVLKRSLFEIDTLAALRITQAEVELFDSRNSTPELSDQRYRQDVCEAIGLNSFEQFVALQHFLFTFDESRHLIFWDQQVSSALLYICFGGDPQDAAKADHLNREMEKAGSRGRNLQYQASNLDKRIMHLESSVETDGNATADVEAATEHYRSLNDTLARSVNESERLEAAASDAELKVMEASAAVVSVRGAYTRAFDEYISGVASPEKHPFIASTISECKCPICAAEGPSVAQALRSKIDAGACPLCTSALPSVATANTERSQALADLDRALAERKRGLDAAVATRTRLVAELAVTREQVRLAQAAIIAFESQNRDTLAGIRGKLALLEGPLAATLSALKTARNEQLVQRQEAYAERDRYRDELKVLQRELERKYLAAESTFVPMFKRLAKQFLGIDLDVTLASSAPTGLHLEIELRGSSRRMQTQLSESQRFFIDIALRMALAQYVSNSDSLATLFIDTPEGSLDIAYEDRAGQMFAEFVRSGHSMIMTANINSSKLLTSLAQACGGELMQIVQMTHWTELSDVQRGAEGLFRAAFDDIGHALTAGRSAPSAAGG